MITTGAKLWLGVAGFALAAAVAYWLASDDDFGTLVLVALASAGVILGVLAVVLRDGDRPLGEAQAEEAPPTDTRLPAAWPALGALGVGVTVVGLAAGGFLVYAGLGLLAAVTVEWMVQGWAERSTGDPAYNRALRNRIMQPVEFPAIAVIVIVGVLLGFSRVLLALPKEGSTVVAIAVASLILATATLLATRPRITSSIVAVVVVIGAVALLGGGVVGAVVGERDIEPHEEEEAPAAEDGGGDGADTTTTTEGSNP